MSAFHDLPQAARYLLTGLHHQTCAVVGNSPAMTMRMHGTEIDRHDVVIRFNYAPTRGYEKHARSTSRTSRHQLPAHLAAHYHAVAACNIAASMSHDVANTCQVGSKTTDRVMGRSWVWNESADGVTRPDPHLAESGSVHSLHVHRYNNPAYLEEDLKLNKGFPIATLEHYFARSAFLLGMHAGKKAKQLKQNATAAERLELRRYRWGHERLSSEPSARIRIHGFSRIDCMG